MDQDNLDNVEVAASNRAQWIEDVEELPSVATRGAAERNNGSNTRAE